MENINPEAVDEFLEHFGVKGMHWGVVRSATPTGASRSTNRVARKDATEFAKAKMFYGEGAGTRRKLIKAQVEAKAKKDPEYKKAFDHHLANQDLGKRASQARGERRRTDAGKGAVKHTKSVHRLLTGGFGNVTLASSVVVGAGTYAHAKGYDKKMFEAGKKAYSQAAKSATTEAIKNLFKNGGWK